MASVKKYYDEDGNVIIPGNPIELQELMEEYWEEIFSDETEDKEKVKVYNQAAKSYNKLVGREDSQLITNFKQQLKDMATKKAAAAKKAAPKKKVAAKKAAPKKKSAAPKKKDGERKPSQKDQIVLLADQGMTIDEIVAETGIQKANVQWYFSKLKLSKKKK